MKDYIKQLIGDKKGNMLKMCVVREYLHARILQTLQEIGGFQNWAFHGGTALRFLYSIPRFSEDLDFALIQSSEDLSFLNVLKKVKSVFEAENYELRLKINDKKTVASAFVLFDELLFELEISPRHSQVLSIKIEVDRNPPSGATLATTLIRRYVTLNLLHHDKASLIAGKLHALLTRTYVKGRDLYDLVWYLADRTWPEPNLTLLNSALAQTDWKGPPLTPQNWRKIVLKKISGINWDHVRDDVRPFLESENDIALVTEENCAKLLIPS
jgi:predicted nucleotidyltransferase component of viral defense system